MFYIRSSATMRKRYIKRLEPKFSDESEYLENKRNMEAKLVQTSPASVNLYNHIVQKSHKVNPKLSTLPNKPPSNNQLRFSKIDKKVICVENLTIPTKYPLTEANTSFSLKFSKGGKSCVEKTEQIRNQPSQIDKGNGVIKRNKIDEMKTYNHEKTGNTYKVTQKEEKKKQVSSSSKNSRERPKSFMRFSPNSTPTKLSSRKKISYESGFHRFNVPVSRNRESFRRPIYPEWNNMNVHKIPKDSDYRKSHEKVTRVFKSKAMKDPPSKSNNTSHKLKSDLFRKYQVDGSNKKMEMIYFSEVIPGTHDASRNGSGDSELFLDNNLQYLDTENRDRRLQSMSKTELEKLEKFRRINLKIMEAVSNTSDSDEVRSVSTSDIDEFDGDSEIESLEVMRRMAENEEEEEALNNCALDACLFLEKNYPNYFQHLIKRYQLDVRTSDHSELKTRKQDIIRIASQNDFKLQNMEKMYKKY